MSGRQNKVGLDYFELDCHMDEKVRLVQAEYGLKGFAVFVKLLQEIYGGYGYYCEWTQDRELLFASENGLNGGSQQLLGDIVEACIRRNIFSERLFKEYGILTSSGVQKQYLKATVKREVVELKKEYLLISVPINRKNVVINSISSGTNDISDTGNAQSRVEKSKVYPPISPNGFNCFWEIYPKKVRILKAEEAYRQVLFDDSSVEEEDLKDAAANYAESVRILDTQERYILNPENFLLRGAYTDYLPGNYKKPQSSKKVQLNQMMHGNYDYAALEKQMLGVDQ